MTDTSFSHDQFESIYPAGIENHYWNNARNRIVCRLLKKHKLSREKILEIGCGKGIVVEFLRSRKIECFGVELANVKPVAGTAGFIFSPADAFQLPQDFRDSINTILILDVLEHLENPAKFLDSILVSYANVKQIVITVPARQELWTNYDTFNGHFRRYRLGEIIHLRDRYLPVREAGYFNHVLYPVFLSFAKLIGKRGTVIKAPTGIGIILHSVLSLILQLDYLLIPGAIPGTSIIALFTIRRL